MDTPDVTVEEWLKALEAAGVPQDAEGYTTEEWLRIVGCSERNFIGKRKMLMKAGRMILGGFRWGKSADGKRCKAPVYRLVQTREERA